jgi:hypothetical protein
MWKRLWAIHEQHSRENIHILQSKFFSYKMQSLDTVAVHISRIKNMARQLSDLGCPIPESMVVTKILCSLPPSFNTVGSAWDNLPTEMQIVHNLTVRFLKQETVNKMQGAGTVESDHAFFSKI